MAGWTTAVAVVASVVGGVAIAWPLLVELEVSKCEKPKYSVVRRLPLAPVGGGAAGTAAGGAGGRARAAGALVVEVRRYAPLLIAEASVDAKDMKEAGSQGFRRLAGFIFGKNVAAGAAPGQEASAALASAAASPSQQQQQRSAKMAMTSPVIMEVAAAGPSAKVAMTSPVIMRMGQAGEGGASSSSASASAAAAEAAPAAAPAGARVVAKMAFTMPSKFTKDSLPVPLDGNVRVREVPARTVAALKFRGQVRSQRAYERPAAALRAALAADGGAAIVGPLEVYQYHPPFTWGFLRVNEVAYEVTDALAGGGAGGSEEEARAAAAAK